MDDTGIPQAVSEDLENLAKPPAFIGTLAKESVDFITIQTPEYDQVPEFEPVELIHDDEWLSEIFMKFQRLYDSESVL